MTRKNLEELEDTELINLYQEILNFIKFLESEAGDKE